MSFDRFRATGRDVPDLGEVIPSEGLAGEPGRVYLDVLFIQDTSAWPDADDFRNFSMTTIES